jgi:plasmid stabilization system protein ParE
LQHDAGETGLRWFRKIKEAVASLSEYPFRCPLAPEAHELSIEVRQLIYGRKRQAYRILFTVEGDTVFVLHVRHGRRAPDL